MYGGDDTLLMNDRVGEQEGPRGVTVWITSEGARQLGSQTP